MGKMQATSYRRAIRAWEQGRRRPESTSRLDYVITVTVHLIHPTLATLIIKCTVTVIRVDVKLLHAKIGELTLENDFLEGALNKAGLLSAKR